jgi:hypothetical protein
MLFRSVEAKTFGTSSDIYELGKKIKVKNKYIFMGFNKMI